ncbi:MAG: ATP synthase F1 subunit delta [Cyclobacteriaceae bacterium]
MSTSRIASRYAKPILELAVEKKVLDSVKEDMASFVNICSESKDFSLMLKSPIIPHLRKAQILNKLFKGKMNDLTLQAFNLITRKNRESLLSEIAEEFLHLYNINKGLQEVTITSSTKLSAEQKAEFVKLSEKITGKTPLLEEVVDPEIIGGYLLKVEDRQIDQSVSGQLKDIKLKLQTN